MQAKLKLRHAKFFHLFQLVVDLDISPVRQHTIEGILFCLKGHWTVGLA